MTLLSTVLEDASYGAALCGSIGLTGGSIWFFTQPASQGDYAAIGDFGAVGVAGAITAAAAVVGFIGGAAYGFYDYYSSADEAL